MTLFGTAPVARPVGAARVPEEVRRLGEELPEGIRLGGSTWSFPGWAGLVYDRAAPAGVLAREGLAAYAEHPLLGAVGIDRTFYEPLPAERFAAYAADVPAGFRFVVKAHRDLTLAWRPEGGANPRFLDPVYAAEAVVAPWLEGLGEAAGPLVFQFSPQDLGSERAFARRLGRFFGRLQRLRPLSGRREDPLYAVEIRDRRLLGPAYAETLAEQGVAHVVTQHPSMPPPRVQAEATLAVGGPALVVRWLLADGDAYRAAGKRYAPFDRLQAPDPAARAAIAELVLAARREGRTAYVTINNNAEGSAPCSVVELARAIVAGPASAAASE